MRRYIGLGWRSLNELRALQPWRANYRWPTLERTQRTPALTNDRNMPGLLQATARAPAIANDLKARDRLLSVAASVVDVLTAHPGIGSRTLRAEVRRLRGTCADADTDAARALLAAGVQVSVGPRGDRHYTLDLAQAPHFVRAYLAARTTP